MSRQVLRQILREVRLNMTASNKQPTKKVEVSSLPLTNHILAQYRRHAVTEKQHCKANQELNHLASNYATYLTSQRLWLDVHQEYHAKSERTVADTAKIVGFKLPHDPK